MKILLKKVLIADNNSKFNNLQKDILISNNIIVSIEDIITESDTIIFEEKDTIATVGWIDIFSHFNDPGFEYNETIETGTNTAIAGGYTTVFVLPNTKKVIDTKIDIEYITQKNSNLAINILPIGAITQNIEGKNLAEMYDMQQAGAIAFSDGLHAIQNNGLMLKALQYIKAFNGTIIQQPIDNTITKFGLMNEGIASTKLGMKGLPKMAEILAIKRDIDLLRYTESKLHITGVSTIEGIELIYNAKQEGLQISCSVTPYHLFFCDEDLQDYDTNLKLNSPLRTKQNMMALREAVLDGKIDCIATHHFPQHNDNKVCEFEQAAYGMIGLQTAFAAVNSILPQLSNEVIGKLFSTNASSIFNLPQQRIEVGSECAITLFSRNKTSTFIKENNKSKSQNSPFFQKKLKGKVLGVVNKGKLFIN